MNEQNIIANSFKAWILAARPKTLTGAALPVIVALASYLIKQELTIFVLCQQFCVSYLL